MIGHQSARKFALACWSISNVLSGMGLQIPFGEMVDREMGLQMPPGDVTEPCQEWAYGCHLGSVDRIRDSLARTRVFEKDRCFPGLLQVFDLQSLHADTFLARYRYRSTINRSQIFPGQIQVLIRNLKKVGRDSFPGWIQVQTSDLRMKDNFLVCYMC